MSVLEWFRRRRDPDASIPLPKPQINWEEPWREIEDRTAQSSLQRELKAEIGPQHPLWGTEPVVFGRHSANDDVLVALSGDRYAIVHLIWHGHVDQYPSRYPATTIYPDLDALKKELANEASAWRAEQDEGAT